MAHLVYVPDGACIPDGYQLVRRVGFATFFFVDTKEQAEEFASLIPGASVGETINLVQNRNPGDY